MLLIGIAAMALALAACSGTRSMGSAFEPEYYKVRSGDTLYAIAWRYGRNVEDLIAWNRLDSPDELAVGQRVRLYPPSGFERSDATVEDPARERVAVDEAAGVPDPAPDPADQRESHADNEGDASRQTPGGEITATGAAERWDWPARGEIVGTFEDGLVYGRGLDIAGEEGEPVRASAGGEVVYSGEGLQAYGPLVIIRHSGEYLSAYAHNRRLLVEEGDRVEVGEPIAEMGLANGDRPLLHFEIRREGSPVDPLNYLPARD